ncbi:MAG: protein TolR [Desulfobacterales bacterium]|jgi:biopolymer transport protein TolR|nr:protein TolR [Desulfobacterales bacterium]MDZ7597670.1 protein TolR [Desulfobacterales bacterium]
MNAGGSNNGLMSEINVTPFVDVMLVLLIIFMVTAPMMVQGVDVSLPEASSAPMQSDQEHLVITVDKNQQVFINELQVEVDFLQEKLLKILEGREDRQVFLKADRDIAYGIVVRVMAEVKAAGVEKLGMITLPVSSDDKAAAPVKGN